MSLKQRLQSLYAVGMVAFLEVPLLLRLELPEPRPGPAGALRAYFLGERRRPRREKVAVLCASPPRATRSSGRDGPEEAAGAEVAVAPSRHDVDVTLLTCSVAGQVVPPGTVDFRALASRPSRNGKAPDWVVPPLVEIIDFLEEEEFSALHTDSAAGPGLVTLAAARLLHLPVTGAVDRTGPEGAGRAR